MNKVLETCGTIARGPTYMKLELQKMRRKKMEDTNIWKLMTEIPKLCESL